MSIFNTNKKIEPRLDLEKIYQEHKHELELLLVKDFVGYIPKDVSEPTLKCFKEYGEAFERWTLWQSWFVNTRAMNDPLKIPFYNGMMVYLKVLNTMAKINKRNSEFPQQQVKEAEVATSFLEEAMSGLKQFNEGIKKNTSNKSDKTESTDKVQG